MSIEGTSITLNCSNLSYLVRHFVVRCWIGEGVGRGHTLHFVTSTGEGTTAFSYQPPEVWRIESGWGKLNHGTLPHPGYASLGAVGGRDTILITLRGRNLGHVDRAYVGTCRAEVLSPHTAIRFSATCIEGGSRGFLVRVDNQ